MQWKILVMSYENITVPGGTRTATPAELQRAKDAFLTTFTKVVAANTGNKLTAAVTIAPTIKTLSPKTPYTSAWWPTAVETRADLDKVPWCEYDSIFVVAPFQGDPGGFGGWGMYGPAETRGATYAALPTGLNLNDCNGDWMVHEFLHGACAFFMQLGYPMPQPKSPVPGAPPQDGVHVGGDYYPELTKPQPVIDPLTGKQAIDPVTKLPKTVPGCFSLFYRDLMRGESRPGSMQTPPVAMGIPLAAWELGTPRNVDALAGRTSSDPAGFRAAFRELAPAWPVAAPGRPDAQPFKADGGERQHFRRPDGNDTRECVLAKGSGQGVFAIQPKVWDAVTRGGGLAALGYPTGAPRSWGAGKVQDFRKGTAASAVMQATGKDAYSVQARIWTLFSAAGGAPTLGYPTNDLHPWGDGQLQDFQGPAGWFAIMEGRGRAPFLVTPAVWKLFLEGGGAPTLGYPTSALRSLGEGKLQEFTGPSGGSAVMQGTGRSPFLVPPKIWAAYSLAGGVTGLGYPVNGLHDWGAGKIQDFKLASGWDTGVMLANGKSQAFTVKGLIWRHYVSKGGALGYLGYPVTDEYTVTAGDNRYWKQTFTGGQIRINQRTSVAEDYR